MGSVNKVILVGNLGRDAELRYTPGGAAVATLNMATTEVWNDKAVAAAEWAEAAADRSSAVPAPAQGPAAVAASTSRWASRSAN